MSSPSRVAPFGSRNADSPRVLRRDTEETPFPPVDSSTEQKPKGFPVPGGVDGVEGISQKPSLVMEQKPKGFPVPDGVDGVEGISQKPSLVIYRRPIGVVSERKRSTPVRGRHCSDSLFAALSVISERKEFYSGQSNAGW